MADLEFLKRANQIEDVIAEGGYKLEPVRDGKLAGPDGLVVDPGRGFYSWPTKGERGDVINWLRSRFGWNFGTAVKFLANRAALPKSDLWKIQVQARQVELEEEQQGGSVVVSRLGVKFTDPRLVKAARLGADWGPEGLEKLIRGCYTHGLIQAKSWIPTVFVPLRGRVSDFGDGCLFCGQDFDLSWSEEGEAFLAVELNDEFQFIAGEGRGGIYCSGCVDKFRRWLLAFQLILEAHFAEPRDPALPYLPDGRWEEVGS